VTGDGIAEGSGVGDCARAARIANGPNKEISNEMLIAIEIKLALGREAG
jgi:hypothetical protein